MSLVDPSLDNSQASGAVAAAIEIDGLERIGDVAINATDALVRRAGALPPQGLLGSCPQ